MLRWSVLAVALLVNAPTLYQALIVQSVGMDAALIRLLVTVPIVAVLLAGVRWAAEQQGRRRADGP